MVPARGKSTVQTSFIWLVKVASRGRSTWIGADPYRSIKMQPRDEKTAELYLTKRNRKKRLKLFKTCLCAIKVLVSLFSLIDKYWSKIVAFFE